MTTGLSVSDVVSVSVSLNAVAGGYRNFAAFMVVGSSPTIDVNERKRLYTGIDGVAADFGTTAPEYLWAQTFFSQQPQPNLLYIGRWAQTATAAVLHGASLTPAQRLMSVFNAITSGGFTISINGTAYALTGLNFSAATNLNGVASIIQTALIAASAPAGTRVIWGANNLRFDVISGTAGPTSTISYATAPATGTDISVILGLSATANSTGANANPPVNGVAAESALSCISLFGDKFGDWYGADFAPLSPMTDADKVAVAGYIEAASQSRIAGVSTQNTAAYDSTRSDDVGAVLKAQNYGRTLTDFSSTSVFPAASVFGRAATIDYTGSDTTITFKFKQQPGIQAETLSENQAAVLKSKNYNVFVNYQNGTAILQEGVMANGTFIDSRINADWFANRVQTDIYDLLLEQPKVPQTDDGMNLIKAVAAAACDVAVSNGYVAPGVWNGPAFGTLKTGDLLPEGYYVYIAPVATQSETDRMARKTPPIQIALKEAGAVHSASVLVTVNP